MKKVLFFGLVAAFGMMTFVACDQTDNPANPGTPDNPGTSEPSALETYYFSVENGSYVAEEFPAQTVDETIQGLSVNTHAIKGGTNQIQVNTSKVYTEFYIGAAGVPGYILFIPTTGPAEPGTGEGGTGLTEGDLYKIALMFSTQLEDEITLLVSAKDDQGQVTKPIEIVISFVETQTELGDLNVNLFFTTQKDVDLHLILPNGMHIYYGNRGGSYETEDGEIVSYGLDLDSNAGCSIDNVNNENIFIPASLVMNGTYEVQVDMWSQCEQSSLVTDWQVIARYNNELLVNEIDDERFAGKNPVAGIYPVGSGSGDHTPVMRFTITNANDIDDSGEEVYAAPRLIRNSFKPTPLKAADWNKLTDEEFAAAVKRFQN